MASTERGSVRAEVSAKRVRAYLHGNLVADTVHPLLVWEVPYYPAYYIPRDDIRAELGPTGETKHSPSLGDGQVHHVMAGDSTVKDAALVYTESPIPELGGHVRLDWASMTSWFEEDEEVFTHVRDPRTRLDILPTSRHVQVLLGNVVLAETTRAHVLFETYLPPRWYVPQVDVRMDLLRRSDTVTHCPYKGTTVHYTATVDGHETADVAWSYPTPLPESQRIAGLLAFYDNRVRVLVDGQQVGG
ncbi:MAG: DUF427 domain-containing protein [Acidimicrobiales bacterium]